MSGRALGIADAGELIGQREERALHEDDLDEMSAAEAEALVRKDEIWPTPDWRELITRGVEPQAAALIKIIRDRIPVRPNYAVQQLGTHHLKRRERDPDLVRRDYVRMLSIVSNVLMDCRTSDEVRSARTTILEEAGWTPRAGHDIRHLVISVWRDRIDSLQIDYRDAAKAETMVREGWPGVAVPTWRRGYTVRADGEGGYLLAKGMKILSDGFPSEEAAWQWLRRDLDGKRSTAAPRPALPSRPIIAEPVRTGLPERRDGDVAVLGFLDTFGLRAVEFGKWVPQAERQLLLNRTFDALYDLAETLGIPAGAIGLGGTMALSFGARAAGGTGADYDPRLRVIALPRASGAGELAHCWAHAFDHWSGEIGVAGRIPTQRMASGHLGRDPAPVADVAHLTEAEAEAWHRVTRTMWHQERPADDAVMLLRADIARREAEIVEAERQRDAYLARSPQAASTAEGARYLEQFDRWLRSRRESVLPGLMAKLAGLESDASAGPSQFAAEARKLSGRDGSFWSRPTELFARAFEAHVFDRLTERGGLSEFLVHSVEEDRYGAGFRGNPYPAGEERLRIGEAMTDLIAAMAPRLVPKDRRRACKGEKAASGPLNDAAQQQRSWLKPPAPEVQAVPQASM